MDSLTDGAFCFLHSWSDDLDPATRRARGGGVAVIDLEGVYLPEGDGPAVTARSMAGGQALAMTTLTVAAAWLLMRAPAHLS